MVKALFPGSFDPITFGHLDLIRRVRPLFDALVLGVGINPSKRSLFSTEERLHCLREVVERAGLDVELMAFEGLLVSVARQVGARVVVRGIRNASDFDYESSMALTNRTQLPDLETAFFVPSPQWTFLSSRFVREIAAGGGDLKDLVPEPAASLYLRKLRRAEIP